MNSECREEPMQKSYGLMVRFTDAHTGEFLELGGAAWLTRREQMHQWESVPTCSGQTSILLDRHAANGDLEDTRYITSQIASVLLGQPFGLLVEEARHKLALEKLEDMKRARLIEVKRRRREG